MALDLNAETASHLKLRRERKRERERERERERSFQAKEVANTRILRQR